MRSATTQFIRPHRAAPAKPHGVLAWIDKLLTALVSGLKDDAYIH